MGYQNVLFCDECGRQRSEAVNHWHVVKSDPDCSGAIILSTFVSYQNMVTEWDRDSRQDADGDSKFFCSQKCLTTIFQRWMDYGVIDKEAAAKVQEERYPNVAAVPDPYPEEERPS